MEDGLLKKTGKSLQQWIQILNNTPLTRHGEMVSYLKTEYGFTHGYANFVALKAREADAASFDPEDLIRNQFQGKAQLKPIYDTLHAIIGKFGQDVEVVPKKANVSFRRKRQFALVQPSTKKRVDLGLKLDEESVSGRLEGPGIFGSMCSHRVRLSAVEDVDDEVVGWLHKAYEQAG